MAKPIEALQQLIQRAFFISHDKKPGEVLRRAPKELREDIQNLSSDETRNIRVDGKI